MLPCRRICYAIPRYLFNYYRKFVVSNAINPEGISALLENGVLTIKLPKREEAKPKKIEIKAE